MEAKPCHHKVKHYLDPKINVFISCIYSTSHAYTVHSLTKATQVWRFFLKSSAKLVNQS